MFAAIEIGSTTLKVSPTFDKDFFDKIRAETSFRVAGCEYSPQYRYQGWDGMIQPFRKDQTAPVGLYYRIKRILKRAGYKVEVVYLVDYPPKGTIYAHGLTLADFQIQITELAVEYRICVFSAPIRSGKTAIISAIINRIDQYPVCVVTKYKDLVQQTRSAIAEHTQKPVGCFSESKFKPADIWVTSYEAVNALNRGVKSEKLVERNKCVMEAIRATKVLLLDECQFVGAATKTNKALNLYQNIGYRIGFSGTPKKDEISARQLEVLVGPIIKKIKYKKLIDSGRLTRPKVYLYELPNGWFDFSLDDYADIYKCNIVNNSSRNAFITELVRKLHEARKSSYIMVAWKEHGFNLQRMIPNSFFMHGATATDVRFDLYEAVQAKKLTCLIGTVGKIGLNLPKLDAVINAEGYASSVITIQKMRSLTACEGKKHGFVLDFIDSGKHLFLNSRKRLKIYYGLDGFEVKLKRVTVNNFRRSPDDAVAE